MGQSPLDGFLQEINILSYARGLSNKDIVQYLLDRHGITTSEAAIRRAKRRYDDSINFEYDDSIPKPFWGFGGPATLDLPKKTGDYSVVGLFDMHGEFIDEDLFKSQLRFIRENKPDLVILGGDIDNFDIISRWQHKILSRMSPIQIHKAIRGEIEDGKRIRERVRIAMDGVGILVEVEGNHGDRLRKYLSDDIQEGWDTSIEWRDLDNSVDHYYTRAGVFIRPEFLVRHGDTTAQYPASKEYRDTRCSGWTGHLHKYAVHAEPPFHLKEERFIHTIAPASCRLDYNYGPGNSGLARWHQGMLAGSFSASNAHDHVTDVGLWNGKNLRIRGELY